MIELLIEKCRDFVASLTIQRTNRVLNERLQEDSALGVTALNRSIDIFSVFPGLQSEIVRRVVYRPPMFVLARDNCLRGAAPVLLATLIKIRPVVAAHKPDLLSEVDLAIDQARTSKEAPHD